MPAEYYFDLATKGGAYIAPFLLAALIWLARDRNRLIADNKELTAKVDSKSDKLESLSERTIVLMTEWKGLMSGRRTDA